MRWTPWVCGGRGMGSRIGRTPTDPLDPLRVVHRRIFLLSGGLLLFFLVLFSAVSVTMSRRVTEKREIHSGIIRAQRGIRTAGDLWGRACASLRQTSWFFVPCPAREPPEAQGRQGGGGTGRVVGHAQLGTADRSME